MGFNSGFKGLIYVGTEEGAGIIFFMHLPGGSSSDVRSTYATYVHSVPCPQVNGAVWYCLHRKVTSHTDNATKNVSQPGTHHRIRMISSGS